MSQSGGEFSLLFKEFHYLLVLVFNLANVSFSQSSKECLLSLGVHKVDVALKVVEASLPVSNSAFTRLVGVVSSALVVLNHDHKPVDLKLVVEVDTHVAFNSEALDSHLGVVDTALEVVKLGLALVLLFTKALHLVSVGFDGGKEVLKLHGVKLVEVIKGFLSSLDGCMETLEFTLLDLIDAVSVGCSHALLESRHTYRLKLLNGVVAFQLSLG